MCCLLLLYLLMMHGRAHATEIVVVDKPALCKPVGLVGITHPVPCAMLAAILNKRYSACKQCNQLKGIKAGI